MSSLHGFTLTNCWYSYAPTSGVERWIIAGSNPTGAGILGVVSGHEPFVLLRVPGHHGSATIESMYFTRLCYRNSDGTHAGYNFTRKSFIAC